MPEAQRVVLGEGALAVQRGDHGDPGALGQLAQLGVGARPDHAVAGHDQRLLGALQQLDRLADLPPVARGSWAVAGQVQLHVPVGDDARLLRVLGDVDQHRGPAAGGGDVERLLEDERQLLGSSPGSCAW
jgi:hypothetical protein